MQRFTARKAVFLQVIAVLIATVLEEVSRLLERRGSIGPSSAQLMAVLVIAILLGLPTFVIFIRIRSTTIKFAFITGGAFLIIHHLLPALLPSLLPLLSLLVDAEAILNYFGVGFLMVAIFAAVIEPFRSAHPVFGR